MTVIVLIRFPVWVYYVIIFHFGNNIGIGKPFLNRVSGSITVRVWVPLFLKRDLMSAKSWTAASEPVNEMYGVGDHSL